MSYDHDKSKTPHLDAMAIGFGVLTGIYLVTKVWPFLADWAQLLVVFMLACWAFGWTLIGIRKFIRWCIND